MRAIYLSFSLVFFYVSACFCASVPPLSSWVNPETGVQDYYLNSSSISFSAFVGGSTISTRLDNLDSSTATLTIRLNNLDLSTASITLNSSNTNYVNLSGSTQTKTGGFNVLSNIGIGITSPIYPLSILGSIGFTNPISTNASIVTSTTNFTTNNSFNVWLPTESSRSWFGVAMSANGAYQSAVNNNGQIYVSYDYGQTWAAKDTNRNWQAIAMSADGSTQAATVLSGQIYVSTNAGNTWSARDSNRSWAKLAMSADGSTQTAVASADQIYVSTNSGNTWNARGQTKTWRDVCMSSSAIIQTAAASSSQLYVSNDSGATWVAKGSTNAWRCVDMSADGSTQTAAIFGGQIYTSNDYGNTWSVRDSSRNWISLSMSTDGIRQSAVVLGGQIYVSTDSGNTWNAKDTTRSWEGIAMSANGLRQTAVATGGQIYLSVPDSNNYLNITGTGLSVSTIVVNAIIWPDGTVQVSSPQSGTNYQPQIDAINASTASLTNRINNLDSSTSTLTTRLNNLDSSTSSLTAKDTDFNVFRTTATSKIDAFTLFKATGEPLLQSWSLAKSTTVSLSQLNSTAAAVTNSFLGVAASTANLTTRLNNLDTSTSTLTTRIGNLDTSTSTLTTRLNNLDISTAILKLTASNTNYALVGAAVAITLPLPQGGTNYLTNFATGTFYNIPFSSANFSQLQIRGVDVANSLSNIYLSTAVLTLTASNTNYVNLSISSQTKSGNLTINSKLGVSNYDYTYGLNVGTHSGFGFRNIYDGYFYAQNKLAEQPANTPTLLQGTLWGTATFPSGGPYVILHAAGDISASNGGIEYTTTPNVFQVEFEYMFATPACGRNAIGIYWNSNSNPNGFQNILGGYNVWNNYFDQTINISNADTLVTSSGLVTTSDVWHKAKIKVNSLERSIDAYFDNMLAISTRTTVPLSQQYMGIMTQVACGTPENRVRNIKVTRGAGISGFSAGSILVADSTMTVTEDNANFYYDKFNARLGIGTNTVTSSLDVVNGSITVRGTNAGVGVNGVDLLSSINSTAALVTAQFTAAFSSITDLQVFRSTAQIKIDSWTLSQSTISSRLDNLGISTKTIFTTAFSTNYLTYVSTGTTYSVSNSTLIISSITASYGVYGGTVSAIYFREVGTSTSAYVSIWNSTNSWSAQQAFMQNVGIGTVSPLNALDIFNGSVSVRGGSIGIGTTTPSSSLDINNGSITIRGTNAGLNILQGTFTVTTNGNVGINTISPTAKLHIFEIGSSTISQNNLFRISTGTTNLMLVTATSTIIAQEPWHYIGATGEPAFSNSWVNYDASAWTSARYMKDSQGFVHVEGMIKNGTINTAYFTLPVGYRPAKAVALPIGVPSGVSYCYVNADGTIQHGGGSTTWNGFSLIFWPN